MSKIFFLRIMILAVVFTTAVFIITGCGDGMSTLFEEKKYTLNNSPVIDDFSANMINPHTGQSVTLTVTANDPDGDALIYTYDFTAGSGTIVGSGTTVAATVNAVGTNTVRVTVTDSHGGSTTQTLDLTGANQAPSISSFTAAAGTIWNNGTDTKTLISSASDPDGDPFTYSYSLISGTGTITGSVTTTEIFTAGTGSGMNTVRVTVTDSYGGQTTSDAQIKVCGWRQLVSTPDSINGVPAARTSPTAVYDGNNNFILFGGHEPSVSANKFNDVWKYAIPTQTWTRLNANQAASASYPSARNYHSAAFVSAAGMIVLGGTDATNSCLGEVWQYDSGSASWTEVTTSGSPGSINLYDAATDGNGNIFIHSSSNQLYKLNTGSWTWTNNTTWYLNGRNSYNLVCDGSNVVLFGGKSGTNYYNDVWVWPIPFPGTAPNSPKNNGSSGAPSKRYDTSTAYDGSGKMFLFGGNASGTATNDVWLFDISGGTWIQLNSFNAPSARYYHKAVYYNDSSLGKTMFVFGTIDAGDTEVWQYVLP